MARMYPAQISETTKSPGELEIFRRLRNDPLTNNWLVLHSLDVASHVNRISGEIDFVVIVPSKGVLCLEVKATSSIKREDGMWFYGRNPVPDKRGPFKQASEGLHSIRKKVTGLYPDLYNIVFWSAVVFPYVEFRESSVEWHNWQIIDSRLYKSYSMGQNIINVLNSARKYLASKKNISWFNPNTKNPDLHQSKKILEVLRPEFEFFESPKSRSNRRDFELKQYTHEQFDALDGMTDNLRVIFTGPAGTGKTLLAVEATRRSATRNNKTLLVCFNKLLGNWLSNNFSHPYATISTLHGQMLAVAKLTPPSNPTQKFWEEELPFLALEKILEGENTLSQYDTLIIDEAQDILQNNYLDFLDMSLKGGLSTGNWIMFGDFEKQIIFNSGTMPTILLQNRFCNVPRYSLRINCRNTPRIAELVHLLGDLDPNYSRIRRPDNNIEPKLIPFKKNNDQLTELKKVLDKLLKENFQPNEIVILSSRNDSDCVAALLQTDPEYQSVISSLKNKNKNRIKFGTIHSFKGLESPIIVLSDIEQVNSQAASSLFYVGITRALDRLYILVNESARKEILEILLESQREEDI